MFYSNQIEMTQTLVINAIKWGIEKSSDIWCFWNKLYHINLIIFHVTKHQ